MDYTGTGHIIADARKKVGLTQKQLAEQLNISDRTVSKWECGKGFPDPSLLEPLSDALQIPLLDIVRGEHVDISTGEELRLREAVRVLHREARKRTVRILKKVCIIVLLILIGENVVFSISTGGDGLRRREWVELFRDHYEQECDHYRTRGVYRAEWIYEDKRIVITDSEALNKLLAEIEKIELGEEYTDWGPGSAEGYLILTTDDGEMTDSRFILHFPGFTISAVIGEEVGRKFYYEATINEGDACSAIESMVEQLAESGKAVRYDLGT